MTSIRDRIARIEVAAAVQLAAQKDGIVCAECKFPLRMVTICSPDGDA